MEAAVSLQDVANIVTFVAPGYFALQTYSLVYAKRDRDFSRLVIESIVYSLPIVTGTNLLWEYVFRQDEVSATRVSYALLLLVIAVGVGLAATWFRSRWPAKQVAEHLGFGSPKADFIKAQFERIRAQDTNGNAVIVRLKSGAVFTGTPETLSRFTHVGPNYFYFSNLAWLTRKGKWEEREGGIVVERSEIEYIETPLLT